MVFRFIAVSIALALIAANDGASAHAPVAGRNGLVAYIQEGFAAGSGPFLNVADPRSGAKVRMVPERGAWIPAWSPDGRMLAFVGEAQGVSGLFVINSDGSELRQVVYGGGNWLSWSLDSSRIVYQFFNVLTSNTELRIVDVWTGEMATIYSSQEELTDLQWAPGGVSVSFRADFHDTTHALFAIDADGSNFRRIGVQVSFGYEWSPNGSRIAYSGDGDFEALDIFVAFADGTRDINLTRTPEHEMSPRWSPDGTFIAYVIMTEPPELRVVNADGSDMRTIAANAGDAVWSPDGNELTYAVDRFDAAGEYAGSELHVRNLATGRELNLTPDADYGGSHAWQRLPDGQDVVILPPGAPITVPPTTGDAGLLGAGARGSEGAWSAALLLCVVALLQGLQAFLQQASR